MCIASARRLTNRRPGDVVQVTGVRYKDDPAIFAWDIMNEPNCKTGENSQDPNSGRPCADAVDAWIVDMAAFIKSQDPNHLVTIG